MSNKQKLFLTLNIGQKAEEGTLTEFKRYIGVSPVTVVALNPSKAQQEEMYPGLQLNAEPEYIMTDAEGNKTMRLEFHVKTNPDWGNKIDTMARIRFFIGNQVVVNRDQTKCQVIDDFGETTWVTREQFKAQQRPDSCRVTGNYRPCHKGEADLYQFLKTWLNIPQSTKYNKDTKKWETVEDLEKCKIVLDWEKLCNGNIKEIVDIIPQVSDYQIKVCFGIRTTDDNRHYQDICNKVFLNNSSNYYLRFDNQISNLKQNGMYADTVFSSEMLKEWNPEQTTFTNEISSTPTAATDIFGNPVNTAASATVTDVITEKNDLPF